MFRLLSPTQRNDSQRVAKKGSPPRYFGALFSIVSGIFLCLFIILWQDSSVLLASADGQFRWLLRGIFFLSVIGQIWTIRSLESVDVFGTQALKQPPGQKPELPPIVAKGAYRWVRHPAYLTTLIFIWSQPDLTASRLLLNLLFTAWIIIGTIVEERDLVALYGEDYRTYQRSVPMLIPFKFPRS